MESEQRHVRFEACFNFRDIGGYETADGGRLRWGAVYRSGSLHRLSPADRENIMRLGIRTIIDLRSPNELNREGRFDASDAVTFHHVPLEQDDPNASVDTPRDGQGANLAETYVAIANDGRSAVATALGVLAECEYPVVVHCFAGKDRTGIIVALLLSILGVPDETIAADYHLSEEYVAPSVAWASENDPKWAALMASLPPWVLQAPPSAMPTLLDTLREHHGSIDDYLLRTGIDRTVLELLRTRLLET